MSSDNPKGIAKDSFQAALLSILSDNKASTLLEQFACATLLCNQAFPLATVFHVLSPLSSPPPPSKTSVFHKLAVKATEEWLRPAMTPPLCLSPCLAMTLCLPPLTIVHQADALPCMPMPSTHVMLCRIPHGIEACPEFALFC